MADPVHMYMQFKVIASCISMFVTLPSFLQQTIVTFTINLMQFGQNLSIQGYLKQVMLKYYYESKKYFFYTNLNVIRILMNWLAGSSVSRDLRASICLWLYY